MKHDFNRRKFIKVLGSVGLLATTSPWLMGMQWKENEDNIKITILSTNDVHSRIDPFPDDDKRYAGMAGFAQRSVLIKSIREQEKNVLLFDAGDIFQGTPYFNMYGGELEFKLMSEMGYDAATMGNHDFDNGLEGFKKQLPFADFPFICSNYDFSNTILRDATIPYKIIEKEGIKIGVIGIGIKMDGLISKKNYGESIYLDPVEIANKYALLLKEQKCNYVVCISHLGYELESSNPANKMSDKILAANSRNIDYIIGGHTHTFMEIPDKILNIDGQEVVISQAGWGGILLGRLDITFSRETLQKLSLVYTTKKVRSQV